MQRLSCLLLRYRCAPDLQPVIGVFISFSAFFISFLTAQISMTVNGGVLTTAAVAQSVGSLSAALAATDTRGLTDQLRLVMLNTSMTMMASDASRATAAEMARAGTAETLLSAALVQTQQSLAQTQSTLTSAQSTVAQLQSSVVGLISSQNAASQTTAALVQQLAVVANCSARGMLTDGSGSCVSVKVSSTGSTQCSSSPVVPVCSPGFSPATSNTPACGVDPVIFPTTFQCKGLSFCFHL